LGAVNARLAPYTNPALEDAMLSLSSVSKHFGGLQVLQDLDLNIPERGIFGLIGPNGAGKTTLFNLITGLLTPDSGEIIFFGRRLIGLAPHEITRAGVARTFQNGRVFKEMSVLENVLIGMGHNRPHSALSVLLPSSAARTAERRELHRAQELLSAVGLGEKTTMIAEGLSFGEQRRLEIARALATEPKLLLLDEPAAGMNALEKKQLMEQIITFGESSLSILIIEHDMRFIMGLCEQIAVLNFGRLIARGTPAEVSRNAEVIEAYLGENDGPEQHTAR
jgi:branched-chain amino acid transport system ATP-binding protein